MMQLARLLPAADARHSKNPIPESQMGAAISQSACAPRIDYRAGG